MQFYFDTMKYLTILFFISPLLSCSQDIQYYKDYKFDNSYTVIGIGPHWSKDKTIYRQFQFIVDNPTDLNKLKKEWVFNKEVENVDEQDNFNLYVIKNKKMVFWGSINPSIPNIRYNGKCYYFDTMLLSKLAHDHPLNYKRVNDTFPSIAAYKTYYDSAIKQKDFLFLYEPETKFEGNFTVTFDKTDLINSPKAASEILKKEFGNTNEKSDISYSLDEYNKQNLGKKMRMTIDCNKSLFDKYSSSQYPKSDWHPAIIEAASFWKL